MSGMIERYRSEAEIVEAMLAQKVLRKNGDVARALANVGKLVDFIEGQDLVTQDETDNDCYFIFAGTVSIIVKGEKLPYGRGPGDLIGEFAAINPELKRTATIRADEEVVALSCTAADLRKAGEGKSEFWRLMAIELTKRIEQRNSLISQVNERPKIFIVTTEPRKKVAEAIKLGLDEKYEVETWNGDGELPFGEYELETLHRHIREADFGIVLADPSDLVDQHPVEHALDSFSVRFELGYMMAELSRGRTMLLIPSDNVHGANLKFRGVQPQTYTIPDERMDIDDALAIVVELVSQTVDRLRPRLRLKERAS